jgi:hypothetical protein
VTLRVAGFSSSGRQNPNVDGPRLKLRFWNPDDDRLLTPMAFGWGYDIHLHEVGSRVASLAGDLYSS